jgi:hypothetical protein
MKRSFPLHLVPMERGGGGVERTRNQSCCGCDCCGCECYDHCGHEYCIGGEKHTVTMISCARCVQIILHTCTHVCVRVSQCLCCVALSLFLSERLSIHVQAHHVLYMYNMCIVCTCMVHGERVSTDLVCLCEP